ncbi:FKBP-type peptidyl-prolyl cis-trans isomerase [Candidatus Woesearchaeota archaeon]|nr:FKBP-type peptidyl-prolyl cis-trans isomerase [Candidatus Woesearchaeota archaeon]
MRGHGLKYFDLIDTETNIFGGGEIFVYKIDWGGRDTYLRPEVVEPVVKAGSEVAVDYIGYFSNNTVFDSSIRNWQLKNVTWESALEDSSPLRFKIGQGQVIQGFEEGLLGLKESNEKTIEVPPEKGYGMDVSSHPLANKTLFFRVRVASIS